MRPAPLPGSNASAAGVISPLNKPFSFVSGISSHLLQDAGPLCLGKFISCTLKEPVLCCNWSAIYRKDAFRIYAQPIFHFTAHDRDILRILFDEHETPSQLYSGLAHRPYASKRIQDDIFFERIVTDDFFRQFHRENSGMLLIVRRLNTPDISSFVSVIDTRSLHKLLFWMSANIPIYKFIRPFSIHQNVFCYRHRLVLQRIAVRSKAATSPCGPSGSFWLLPDNIIHKVVAFFYKKAMHIERNSDPFR